MVDDCVPFPGAAVETTAVDVFPVMAFEEANEVSDVKFHFSISCLEIGGILSRLGGGRRAFCRRVQKAILCGELFCPPGW